MKLTEKLTQLRNEKKAIIAANFYNLETCKGIIKAAAALEQPVMLQVTEGSIDYMGLKATKKIAEALIAEYHVNAWLHLDHCKDIQLVQRCLDEGFDSVMIDASDKPYRVNIEITKAVVEMAKNYGVQVEAELGYVPKPDGSVENSKFTSPVEAKQFVEETGCQSLAVAIGSKHGFYKEEAKLDIVRLQAISKATDAFLVLHGGSGIPDKTLQAAICEGIVKINIATETKDTFMKCVKSALAVSDEIDLRKIFPLAITGVQMMIEKKIKIASSM